MKSIPPFRLCFVLHDVLFRRLSSHTFVSQSRVCLRRTHTPTGYGEIDWEELKRYSEEVNAPFKLEEERHEHAQAMAEMQARLDRQKEMTEDVTRLLQRALANNQGMSDHVRAERERWQQERQDILGRLDTTTAERDLYKKKHQKSDKALTRVLCNGAPKTNTRPLIKVSVVCPHAVGPAKKAERPAPVVPAAPAPARVRPFKAVPAPEVLVGLSEREQHRARLKAVHEAVWEQGQKMVLCSSLRKGKRANKENRAQ